jgi:hypothetical protein
LQAGGQGFEPSRPSRFDIRKPLTLHRELSIDFFDYFFDPAGLRVTTQLGLYASRMDSGSAHTAIPVIFVECDREEDVRRFRSRMVKKLVLPAVPRTNLTSAQG